MVLTDEQQKDYRDYSLSFFEITKECIPLLSETGKHIQESYNETEPPRHIVFCHDIIKRVRENLIFLTIYPPQKDNSVPLQLILRCIFNDLIWCTYVVANLSDDKVLKPFLDYNDLLAVEGKKSFAVSEKEFFELCGHNEYVNYFTPKIEDLNKTCEGIVAPYGSKSNLKKIVTTKTTKEIAEEFRRHGNLKEFYAVLYSPFKMLSQVEHYANENRSYSYFGVATAYFFTRFAISYKFAIEYICKGINSYIDNSTSCDTAAAFS